MSELTDRELLERAAKAAGIDAVCNDNGPVHLNDDRDSLMIVSSKGGTTCWNPLVWDGDALKLAVKLGLLVDMRYTAPEAVRYNGVTYWPTPMQGVRIDFGDRECDPLAATRRAIVRAAAALVAE